MTTNQSNKTENFAWYIPSVYGDIKLERLTDSSTRVNLVGVSPTEKEAVRALFKHALKPSMMAKPWATQDELASNRSGEPEGAAVHPERAALEGAGLPAEDAQAAPQAGFGG